jgi:putative phosphoesterase
VRRIGLYSDIHGNLAALDAVLVDIDSSGVTERICLGDLVGYGPESVGVIDRVRATKDPVIQGNYDRGVGGRLGDCGCYYPTPEAKADGAVSYAFTVEAVGDEDALWLAGLRSDLRFEQGELRVLICHGSPRRVNEYLMPDRPESQLVRLAAEAEANVVCCGHVHLPYHRVFDTAEGQVHYINSGSVGKPKDGDPRPSWVELRLGETEGEPRVETIVHRVAYDTELTRAAMEARGVPARLIGL